MLKQLATFFEEASLLGPYISGFRKGHSTATSLLGIRDDLKCSVNRNDVSLLVLSDFSKVSDNVRLTTALRKRHRLCFFQKLLEVDDKLLIRQTPLRAN